MTLDYIRRLIQWYREDAAKVHGDHDHNNETIARLEALAEKVERRLAHHGRNEHDYGELIIAVVQRLRSGFSRFPAGNEKARRRSEEIDGVEADLLSNMRRLNFLDFAESAEFLNIVFATDPSSGVPLDRIMAGFSRAFYTPEVITALQHLYCEGLLNAKNLAFILHHQRRSHVGSRNEMSLLDVPRALYRAGKLNSENFNFVRESREPVKVAKALLSLQDRITGRLWDSFPPDVKAAVLSHQNPEAIALALKVVFPDGDRPSFVAIRKTLRIYTDLYDEHRRRGSAFRIVASFELLINFLIKLFDAGQYTPVNRNLVIEHDDPEGCADVLICLAQAIVPLTADVKAAIKGHSDLKAHVDALQLLHTMGELSPESALWILGRDNPRHDAQEIIRVASHENPISAARALTSLREGHTTLSTEEKAALLSHNDPSAVVEFVKELDECGIRSPENIAAFRPRDLRDIHRHTEFALSLFYLHLAGINTDANRSRALDAWEVQDWSVVPSMVVSHFEIDVDRLDALNAINEQFKWLPELTSSEEVHRSDHLINPALFQSVMRHSTILLAPAVKRLLDELPERLNTRETLMAIIRRCDEADDPSAAETAVVDYLQGLMPRQERGINILLLLVDDPAALRLLVEDPDALMRLRGALVGGPPDVADTPADLRDDDESTMRASVFKSTSETATRLKDRYGVQLEERGIERVMSEMADWVETFPNTLEGNAAKLAFETIKLDEFPYQDRESGVYRLEFLALHWLAINDNKLRIGELEDAKAMLADGLYEIQRANNLDARGRDRGGDDDSACDFGTLNKLAEKLKGVHRDGKQRVITSQQASLKLPVVVKEEACEHLRGIRRTEPERFPGLLELIQEEGVEVIWPAIREKVAGRIFDEFGSLYKDRDNPRFTALIEAAVDVSCDDLESVIRKRDAESSREGASLLESQRLSTHGMFPAGDRRNDKEEAEEEEPSADDHFEDGQQLV